MLSLNLKRLSEDFQQAYGHPLYLVETFVDPRFAGTCSRVANWQYVGLTRGWSKSGARYVRNYRPKAVYLHPLEVVVGIAVCAVICGARSYRGIGDWAQGLAVEALRRFVSSREKPPSEPTIRRVLQAIDTEEFDWKLVSRFRLLRSLYMDINKLKAQKLNLLQDL